MTESSKPRLSALTDLIQTVHRLRAPNGCPWDRAQTHQSLRPYLIEEAYEVLDVLDQIKITEDLKKEKIRKAFCEELGDLLMQVLLHSEMTKEAQAFDIYDVANTLNEKLIRRHPHVFGEKKAESADYALQNWEKEKAKEKATQIEASILDGLPKNLPSLQKASRVIEKVTKVGFQWKDLQGPLDKVDEELRELKAEITKLELLDSQKEKKSSLDTNFQAERAALLKKVEGELGDLLFTLSNVGSLLKINPEDALRKMLGKFEKRFRFVESSLKANGKTPEQSDLKEMDEYWQEAKVLETVEIWGLTGGIASGKSSVAKQFRELGIPVIDADQITRELLETSEVAKTTIAKRFGTIDRDLLREKVFSDPAAKKDLEAILHPLIQNQSRKLIKDLSKTHKQIIYEATLLIETGRHQEFDGLIVVEAPEKIRLDRLMTRNGFSKALAEKVIKMQQSQLSDEVRRKYADLLIENTGSLNELREKVQGFISEQGW